MQSKIFRGARRLLVTAGVITLVCSVVAPAAVSASNAGGSAQGQANGQGQAPEIPGQGLGNGLGLEIGGGEQPAEAQGAAKVWVCHKTASVEVNPWELVEVSEHAEQTHVDHHDDRWFTDEDPEALEELETFVRDVLDLDGVDQLHQSDLQQLDVDQLTALTALCTVADDEEITDQEVLIDDETGDDDDIIDDETGDDDDETGDDDDQGGGDDDQGGDDDAEEPQGPRGPKPIQVRDDEVTPPAPLPEPQISFDEVVAPAAPVVNTPAPAGQPEVLGVTTTRTPTRELASGAGVTSLPRTGTDSTTLLALVGGLLVATGVGLEALGRRGHLAAAGGRR